jgi:hypothetical protein
MPRAVVHCQTGDDVRLAIRAAPDRGLPLSARAGGRDRTSKPPLNVRKEFPNERDRKAGGVLPRLSTRRSKPSPLTVLLSTTLALWLLVYLVAGVAETDQDAGARHVACGQCTRTIEEVASLVVYATQAFVATGSALRGGGVVKPTV